MVKIEEIKEIKKYFKRIYTIVSKDVQEMIEKINLSKKKKKAIMRELAFLPEKEQLKYLDEFKSL
ncbi:hypothetical protein LCGC14_1136220 [marine sediment metagenome]|uniref:Uncharacterized protein n=1 Tax=marine sediment metagenome TaxID=412755 RepID=A0A0F9LZQ6_9ZZZZ|nr:MAG: hypothetical protein Lokiarch_04660 [Candidatus Lokiarchaeum sp. GC14_75]